MDLKEYLTVVRRRWVSIVGFTVVGIALAAVFTATSPKVYTASAQSFVALSAGQGDNSDPLSGAQFAAQRVKSYTEVVHSPDVLLPVIDELELPYSLAQLSEMVQVTNPALTVLLDTNVTTTSSSDSAQIADAVAISLGRQIEKLESPDKAVTSPVKVTLTNPATPPTSPTAPRPRVNLALGFILGLAAGLAYAFVRNALDNTVKSPSELDVLAAAPSLGAILFDTNAKTQVLSAMDAKSPESEGYRTIRTNLQFINVDDPVRAVVVTSAMPGDGKTTVACNLAIAIAQTGKKVCLVESDLRRPRVTEYLQLSAGSGLTEVLSGQVTLAGALQTWGRGLLTVLPPGAIPPNPSELLGSHQMANVIASLKSDFDVVILDTPPLLAVSDAAVLASQADGAVVVARYGKSSRDAIRNAVVALEQVEAEVLGTVLNAVPVKRGYGYGYDDAGSKSAASVKARPNAKVPATPNESAKPGACVKSPTELDKLSAAPPLGGVLFDNNAKTQVLSALDTKSIHSEGYRTIRANLQYINVDDPVRAFVITSAAPGDGKTTVACNLAIALAQAGKRVCLVEADLRRPRVSEYLQLNPGAGLTEVLAGQVSLNDALQDWGHGMFQVLAPGAIPPNPSELLGSHQMAQVIASLKRDFDVVILDTPPLLAVSDAAVLASQADGAVVVVRYGKSSRDAVRNAVASLEQINAKVLGTVLNAIPAKRGGAYGYGYGYGYGNDAKGKAAPVPKVGQTPTAPNGPASTNA